MAYEHLKPISGVSSEETTAVTMKTIKELIAEEEAEQAAETAKVQQAAEVAKARADKLRARNAETAQPSASAVPQTDAVPRVQQPPHLHDAVPVPQRDADTPPPAKQKSTKSLFERIFGK